MPPHPATQEPKDEGATVTTTTPATLEDHDEYDGAPLGDEAFTVSQTLVDVFVYEHPRLLQHALYAVDDRQGAEDIVHDTYRAAVNAASELHEQDVEGLLAWMCEHITGLAEGYHEKTRTPTEDDQDPDIDRLEEVFERFAPVDEALRELHQLDDTRRFLIVLAACGYPAHEIAAALDTDTKKVSTQVAQARVAYATTAPRTRKGCTEAREILAALTPPAAKNQARADQHIRSCESCRTFRDRYTTITKNLMTALPEVLITNPDEMPAGSPGRSMRLPGLPGPGVAGLLSRIPTGRPRILIGAGAAVLITGMVLLPRLSSTSPPDPATNTPPPAATTSQAPPVVAVPADSPMGQADALQAQQEARQARDARAQAAAAQAKAQATAEAAARATQQKKARQKAQAQARAAAARKARTAAKAQARARQATPAPRYTAPTRTYTPPRYTAPAPRYTAPRSSGGGGRGSAAGEFAP